MEGGQGDGGGEEMGGHVHRSESLQSYMEYVGNCRVQHQIQQEA